MSVVAISRGSFVGGKRLAERLAEELDFRCVDREVIIDKVAVAGLSHDDLREALTRAPSLFDRWITHKKHLYLALLQVWQHNGQPVDGVVEFSSRQLAEVIGWKWAGTDTANRIAEHIGVLQSTGISWLWAYKNAEGVPQR